MTVMVIFQQPENPNMLGRLPMPDYDAAAWYVMGSLSGHSQSSAIIEDASGHRSMQPHIRMHYERLRWVASAKRKTTLTGNSDPGIPNCAGNDGPGA